MFEIISTTPGEFHIYDSYLDNSSYVNKRPIRSLEDARKIKAALTLEYSNKHSTDKSPTTYRQLDLSDVHRM